MQALRFLCDDASQCRVLQFLAADPCDVVRWGTACRNTHRATSEENEVLWAYVWTRGLGCAPLGERQVRRAKARVLNEIVRRALHARLGRQRRPIGLSLALCDVLVRLRRNAPDEARPFRHIAIIRRLNPYNQSAWNEEARPSRSTELDVARLRVIHDRHRLRRDEARLAKLEAFSRVAIDDLRTEATRLMRAPLKRRKR